MAAGGANDGFHMVEIALESAAASAGETKPRAGHASLEGFFAVDIAGFFQLAGMDAEIAIGKGEKAFELREGQGVVYGKGADDGEAGALVNQAVEAGSLLTDRHGDAR